MDANMRFETIVVGYLETNCYILADEAGDAAVIDPGAEAGKILGLIDRMGAKPKCILLTHTHSDHVGALEGVRSAWNVPVLLAGAEADFLRVPDAKRVQYKRGSLVDPLFNTFTAGDVVEIGSLNISIMVTPGHSPGSSCFLAGDSLFSGDTLFQDGIGRTDFEGGDYNAIMKSLKEQILLLPGGTNVYPGHGAKTTIHAERPLYM